MAQAKIGDIVKVHYTGKLADGTIFDSSQKREPIQFTIGNRKLIPGFEKAVVNLSPGEKVTINIATNEAYGPHKKELVATIDRKEVPKNMNLEIGQMLRLQQKKSIDGKQEQTIPVTITGLTDTHVIIDANHPLAGKDLIFEIELIEIL